MAVDGIGHRDSFHHPVEVFAQTRLETGQHESLRLSRLLVRQKEIAQVF